MHSKLLALTVVLLLALAYLPGCGGDDDSSTPESDAPAATAEADGGADAEGGTKADDGAEDDGRVGNDSDASQGASAGADSGGGDGGADGEAETDGEASPGGNDQAGAKAKAKAGLGGGQGGKAANEAGQGASPGTEDFIARANAICTEGSERLEERTKPYLERKVKKGEETAVLAEIINEVLEPTIEEEIAEIRALGLPAGDEQQIEAIFASMRKVVGQAKADPAAFSKTVEPFEEPEELAIAYGLGSCGGV